MTVTDTVVMVEPTFFSYNRQTAINNAFQKQISGIDIQAEAIKEFHRMVDKIRAHDLNVIQLPSPKANTPDAVFPNNWFSTHVIDREPYLFIYPMFSQNRRDEVQVDALQTALYRHTGKNYHIVDFREKAKGKALEGTGVFIFDRIERTAFLSLSPRADLALAEKVTRKLGYALIYFNSNDQNNQPIYHTNVIMSIGQKLAFICSETISSKKQSAMIRQKLIDAGKKIIDLTYGQICQMAANVLELQNRKGESLLLLSEMANQALTDAQKSLIDRCCQRVPFAIPTIETVGGGSVRCMLAEVFY